ncbi:hypothetical protein EVJ58_g647 [Rhodofomes roseus]|uniref:Uncharacterized protein n=1 Tax=Rhodofomes roseus TaxID=34475 RepID=A0A4Y9Z4T1_9APHY|nr:hypothetical protein EVJ58_g647 [Rhodofomes roseus]
MQMASNRYAAHLADCMGLSTRRGATRNASHKAKIGSDAGRSASPFLGTEDGMLSDDGKAGPAGKGKGKSRAKRVDDAEFNLHRKRPGSPIVSPKKNAKKAKTSDSAGPWYRLSFKGAIQAARFIDRVDRSARTFLITGGSIARSIARAFNVHTRVGTVFAESHVVC